jgi:hypothetical protein
MVEGGVVFATGTPLSNSVVDMYTMQRFLQEDTLSQYGLAPGFAHLAETKAWLTFEKARNDYRKPIAITVPISERQRRFFEECQFRADHLPLDPRQDNILKVLGDARKAALDYRLVDPDAPDDPDSKVNQAVETMLNVYRDHPGKTQMVFLDAGTPDGSMFDLYNDMNRSWWPPACRPRRSALSTTPKRTRKSWPRSRR